MIRRMLCTCVALALIPLSAGCRFRPVQLTTTESGSYEPSRSRDISAKSCGFLALGVIPIALSGRDQRAFARLREEAHGDYIADVEAEEQMTYAVAGFVICTTFHAIAYARLP
jgi:hypothetical protein